MKFSEDEFIFAGSNVALEQTQAIVKVNEQTIGINMYTCLTLELSTPALVSVGYSAKYKAILLKKGAPGEPTSYKAKQNGQGESAYKFISIPTTLKLLHLPRGTYVQDKTNKNVFLLQQETPQIPMPTEMDGFRIGDKVTWLVNNEFTKHEDEQASGVITGFYKTRENAVCRLDENSYHCYSFGVTSPGIATKRLTLIKEVETNGKQQDNSTN